MLWAFLGLAILVLLAPVFLVFSIVRDDDTFKPMSKSEIDKYYDTKPKR